MLAELLIAGLAVWQIVEILHHAEIAVPVRLWALAAADRPAGLRRFVGRLLLCPFCSSVWAGGFVTACLVSPWTAWFPFLLAASRFANLGNDLTAQRCRTPRFNENEDADD